jgi:hypothetical protein
VSYFTFQINEIISGVPKPIYSGHPSGIHNLVLTSSSRTNVALSFSTNVVEQAFEVSKMMFAIYTTTSTRAEFQATCTTPGTTSSPIGSTMKSYFCSAATPVFNWQTSELSSWRVRIYQTGAYDDRTDFWEFVYQKLEQTTAPPTTTSTPTSPTTPRQISTGSTQPPTPSPTTTRTITYLEERITCPGNNPLSTTSFECTPYAIIKTCPYLYERRTSDGCISIENQPVSDIKFERFVIWTASRESPLEVLFSGHPSTLNDLQLNTNGPVKRLDFAISYGIHSGTQSRMTIITNDEPIRTDCNLRETNSGRDIYDCTNVTMNPILTEKTSIVIRPFGIVEGYRDYWQGTINVHPLPTTAASTTPSAQPSAPQSTPSPTTTTFRPNTSVITVSSLSTSDPETINLMLVLYVGGGIAAGAIALRAVLWMARKYNADDD